jgi:hypothetical protein
MRKRLVFLSAVVLALTAFPEPSKAASNGVLICDESGLCGSCCTSAQDCVDWCEDNCPNSSSCPATPNSMCCGEGGLSIECGHVT